MTKKPTVESVLIEQAMTKKGKERCEWEYDEDGDFYHTSCDRDFCFIEGDLKDNNYFYCPGCGKPIKKGV